FGSALDPSVHPELRELAVSAMFVKGIHKHSNGGLGHFHLQITASGVGPLATDSEAELWRKIPDIDGLESFQNMTDDYIVLTLRGIGEMIGDKTSPNPQNRIILDRLGPQGPFDYGTPRALIRLEAGPDSSKEMALWQAMDDSADELALALGNGGS